MKHSFYHVGQKFDSLANTADIPVKFNINNVNYDVRSSEMLFQAVKGLLSHDTNDQNLANAILKGTHGHARSVQQSSQSFSGSAKSTYANKYNGQPEALKYYIMKDLVAAKLTQHPALLKSVIDAAKSGDSFEENAQFDGYWGNGVTSYRDAQGNQKQDVNLNKLGKIITILGNQFHQELNNTGQIKVITSFSAETLSMMAHVKTLNSNPIKGEVITKAQLNSVPALDLITTIQQYEATNSINSEKVSSDQSQNSQKAAYASVKDLVDDFTSNQKHKTYNFNGKNFKVDFVDYNGHKCIKIAGPDKNNNQFYTSYNVTTNKFAESSNNKTWTQVKTSNFANWVLDKIVKESQVNSDFGSQPQADRLADNLTPTFDNNVSHNYAPVNNSGYGNAPAIYNNGYSNGYNNTYNSSYAPVNNSGYVSAPIYNTSNTIYSNTSQVYARQHLTTTAKCYHSKEQLLNDLISNPKNKTLYNIKGKIVEIGYVYHDNGDECIKISGLDRNNHPIYTSYNDSTHQFTESYDNRTWTPVNTSGFADWVLNEIVTDSQKQFSEDHDVQIIG